MIKNKRNILGVTILALLFSFSSAACNSPKVSDQPDVSITDESRGINNSSSQIEIGNEEEVKDAPMAPDFSLTNLQGETVKLSDYKGKVVILNFWASWCPPCIAEMPDFDKVNKELIKENDAVILAVNLTDGNRETEEKARKFINDKGYSLNVLFDKESVAARLYDIKSIPTTYMINRDGSFYKYTDKNDIDYKLFVGGINEDTLLDVLEKMGIKL